GRPPRTGSQPCSIACSPKRASSRSAPIFRGRSRIRHLSDANIRAMSASPVHKPVPDSMAPPQVPRHKPFVPENVQMQEFTLRAVILGLVMSVVLGAANAYLGLRAGQTIAATYPAAVIAMAVLRLGRGSILEENIARTAGSIGESVAAGAVFTIPAFFMVQAWTPPNIPKGLSFWGSMVALASDPTYLKSTSLMLVGSILGVLFVSLVRRGVGFVRVA